MFILLLLINMALAAEIPVCEIMGQNGEKTQACEGNTSGAIQCYAVIHGFPMRFYAKECVEAVQACLYNGEKKVNPCKQDAEAEWKY